MQARPTLGVRTAFRLWTLAAIAFSTVLSSPAMAQDEEQYLREGFYVAASAVYAMEQFRETSGFGVPGDAAGYSLVAGMRANRLAAFEIELETPIQGFSLDPAVGATTPSGNPVDPDDIVTSLLMINGKLHLPFGRFEPFLMYGIGMMYANPSPELNSATGSLNGRGDRVDFAFQAGGGFDVYITPSIVFTMDANYVLPTDRLKPLQHVSFSAGFKYRFGALASDD